jgi:hypothetical protein
MKEETTEMENTTMDANEVPTASGNIKLTRDEMEKIQEIQSDMRNLTYELCNIELQTISLEQKKANMKEKLVEINGVDNAFATELFGKYGKGSIDLEKGEFVKSTSVE